MILLSKSYDGYLAGTIAQFPTSVESALIAQGLGTLSSGPVTAGNVNAGNQRQGRAGIAAAGTGVVITSNLITAESKVIAYLSNAAADATATSVTRVQCSGNGPLPGSITISLNAASTGVVAVDWFIVGTGQTPTN